MDTVLSLLGSGLLGGIFGGLFRLAPEVLKFLNGRSERAHELEMQRLQIDRDKALHDQEVEKLGIQSQITLDKGGLDALIEGIRAQARPSGIKWVDAASQLVRPAVTYWYVLLYSAVKIAMVVVLLRVDGVGMADALLQVWTPIDMSTFVGIINFWFLDRVIRQRNA